MLIDLSCAAVLNVKMLRVLFMVSIAVFLDEI